MIPEYPTTAKTGIAHFINVINPLLSIDINKEIVHKVIKQYMSKVSITYAHHILHLYILQIQFSFHKTGDPNVTYLKILGKNSNRDSGKAFHQGFKCSSIRYCKYTHKDILCVYPAYNRVKIESINDLRKRSSCPHQVVKVDKKLKQSTEKYNLYIIIYISNILTINSYYHSIIQS